MKYVILQSERFEPAVIMGFAPVTHAELAAPWQARGYTAISAGFARIDSLGIGLQAYGGSESLRLRAQPDDTKVLTAFYRATTAASGV